MAVRWLGAIALAALVASVPARAQQRSVESMPDPKVQSLLDEFAGWPEERYYSLEAGERARLEMQLAGATEAGSWITAPGALSVERNHSLPLMLLTRIDAMREWEASEEANGILIASVLSDVPLGPCFAFPSNKRWSAGDWGSRHGRPPDADTRTVFTSRIRTLDARALCKIPWKAGRVALTYISYDQRSNTVITQLTGPAQPMERLPAARVAAFQRRSFPVDPAVDQFPSYVHTARHPEVIGDGIALRLPARIAETALGTIRIRLPAHTILERGLETDPDRPAALIPAEIVILKLDNPHRGVIQLTVPVFAKAGTSTQDGDVAEAYFSIDLYPHIQPSLAPGEYLAYLIVQEYIDGPVKIVVEPSS